MNFAWRQEYPDSKIFNVAWLIEVPGAHPFWWQYAFLLYDLVTEGSEKPEVYMDGATHECVLLAVDPKKTQRRNKPFLSGKLPFLTPPNHGYQFKAESNEAAQARCQKIVDDIVADTLSPDTDFRSMWDARFKDGVTLKQP